MSDPIPAGLQPLYQAAKDARQNSYSPYSGQKVGAALRTSEGLIHSGCNVENSSYGATVCAERVAIQKAVSDSRDGELEIKEIVVVTDADPPWPPCGMCRQVIAEFVRDPERLAVHMVNLQGTVRTFRFSELFPHAFTPSHLKPNPKPNP